MSEKEPQLKSEPVVFTPQSSVAKFATSVTFSKLDNDDIVMTFLSKLDNLSGPATAIETIIVNKVHAEKIVEVLSRVINDKK